MPVHMSMAGPGTAVIPHTNQQVRTNTRTPNKSHKSQSETGFQSNVPLCDNDYRGKVRSLNFRQSEIPETSISRQVSQQWTDNSMVHLARLVRSKWSKLSLIISLKCR